MLEGQLPEGDFDVVVIGSGFGGSVAAHRLAGANRRVCLLERGKAYPPGSFARSPSEFGRAFWDPAAGLHGMFDVWSFAGMEALVSSGLGGGSLIYANVLARKDPSWFVQRHPYEPGIEERWPVSYEDLDEHYGEVERFLSVQTLPFEHVDFRLPKTAGLRDAAGAPRTGATWKLAPLGVRFRGQDGPSVGSPLPDEAYPNLHGRPRRTCRLCGECDIGCNDGAKNTLDHTYLSAAAHLGALISIRSDVQRLARRDGGGFDVDYVVRAGADEGRSQVGPKPTYRIRAKVVVVAAGALGSTKLLLRSRRPLGLESPALGSRFCGNGDLLGFVFRSGADNPRALDATRGPVITSWARFPDWAEGLDPSDLGMYIEDAGYPGFVAWLAETTQLGGTLGRSAGVVRRRALSLLFRRRRSNLSADLARVLGPGLLSSTAMPLLGMGRDVPDGTLYLDDPDADDPSLESTWSTATSAEYFERVKQRMAMLAAALDGRFTINPTYLFRRVITVHPLGGCPMSATPKDGVVDEWGEAWGVPGLFVCDGAAMPGPVGPNPALTIAAFAHRSAERMIAASA